MDLSESEIEYSNPCITSQQAVAAEGHYDEIRNFINYKHTINLTTEPESLGRMNSLMLLSLLADQKKSVSFPSLQKAKVISYHYPPNNSVITC